MQFSDKWLTCSCCRKQFLWDAGEQAWYRLRNFANVPKTCPTCRTRKRAREMLKDKEMTVSRV